MHAVLAGDLFLLRDRLARPLKAHDCEIAAAAEDAPGLLQARGRLAALNFYKRRFGNAAERTVGAILVLPYSATQSQARNRMTLGN